MTGPPSVPGEGFRGRPAGGERFGRSRSYERWGRGVGAFAFAGEFRQNENSVKFQRNRRGRSEAGFFQKFSNFRGRWGGWPEYR